MYDIFHLQTPSPPILSQEIKAVIDINLLRDIRSKMCDIIDLLTKKNNFTSEFEIFSNIFYKFRNQWRREKCLKFMKQVINSIDKFKTMDFIKTMENFKDLIPSRFSVITKEELYLPTSPVFVYLFAKLLTACVIIHKAILYCVLAAIEIQKQMELKLFLSYMTFSLASVSSVKYNLEDLKTHIFGLYKDLLRCFVSIYPTIQFPYSSKIDIWYSTLLSDRNIELNSTLMNHDENKQKAMIDLCEATSSQKNKSSSEIINECLIPKINISKKNFNLDQNKNIKLINKVQNFLKSNSDNILKDKNHIFQNANFKTHENFENLDNNQFKNINKEAKNKQKNVMKNSSSNEGSKLCTEQILFSPLVLSENEIKIFMKKCISTSKSRDDVERTFHKFLKLHGDKQFTGLLISFRNFKRLKKIEKKKKIKDNKTFTKLAINIVRKFVNQNK